MKNDKLPLVLYGENPLALLCLSRLLRPAQVSVVPFSCSNVWARNHSSEFILIADEGCYDISKQRVLHLVREIGERARTLVIGHSASTLHLRQLVLAGVHGFIAYGDLESQLQPALAALRSGRLWMPVRGDEVDSEPGMAARRGFSCGCRLTAHEKIVLELLGRSLSNKEIGNQLRITERTVKFHVSNLFKKLGVRDRRSAATLGQALAASNASPTSDPAGGSPTGPAQLELVNRGTPDTPQPPARAAKFGGK